MTAQLIDGQGYCRACGYPPEEHGDQTCPATRVPGFAKRGRAQRRRKRPDFVDVPLPGATQWNTDGFVPCWPGRHTDYCGCRPVSGGEKAADRDDLTA